MLLLATLGGGNAVSGLLPVASVVEYQVRHFEPAPEVRYPGCDIIASLESKRPGAYQTLAHWDDPEAIDTARAAFDELAVLVATEDRGVLRWDGEAWCWMAFIDDEDDVEPLPLG